MNYAARRQKLLNMMEENSALILYSGVPVHVSGDGYAHFEANKSFFYLTGLNRSNMMLLMYKLASGEEKHILFIEESDPTAVRWMGKKVSVEEAKEITGIEDVRYTGQFVGFSNMLPRVGVSTVYFDCSRQMWDDMADYNAAKAAEYGQKHPGTAIRDLSAMVAGMRMSKDEDEVAAIRQAIHITDVALQNVLSHLKPGMKEYQVQADFEYMVHYQGSVELAFPTIAGSGMNGTMLHYGTNRDECKDGDLILLDLGAKHEGYCADITRTYPVNGKYSDRQRQVYEIVLRANRAIAQIAKAGMTLRELQEKCSDILAKGCIELGLIQDKSEVRKYYMHSVSHHLGLDTHDVTNTWQAPLAPGTVISDEPGLYIDEWGIGIRIEDDLLLTEDGCVCLSEDVIRDPDDIEKFMAEHRA